MSDQPQPFERELTVALEAVLIAARVCRSVQATIGSDVLEKQDNSPVTIADYASQAAICLALKNAFPDDPVIGEEDAADLQRSDNAVFMQRIQDELNEVDIRASADEICHWIDRGAGNDYAARFWTLDPIDGTKGFLRGGQYAIALALIVEGKIELAVLGCPNLSFDDSENLQDGTGTIFYAIRGQGSWRFPLGTGISHKLATKVSKNDDATTARFCESVEKGHSSHSLSGKLAERLAIQREALRLDSQAKYSVVSRGDAEIYLRLPSKKGYQEKIWDHAAGVLVIEEAGGRVSDVFGKPLDFSQGHKLSKNAGVVATNRQWHDRVLGTLKILYEEAESKNGTGS